ncbi:MAG: hypothetical protein ACI88C_000056 [Acidimicrobiales bacterium]|jgi:hypothetical protein
MVATSIYSSVDIYKPEIWAMESLQILFENIGLRGKVKLDFRNEIASEGDTINTRIPDIMVAAPVGAAGAVTSVRKPKAENIQIILNKNEEITFELRDRDATVAMKDLRDEFMVPAVLGLIRAIEDDGIAKMSDETNGFGDSTNSNVIEIGDSSDLPLAFHILAIAEAAKLLHTQKVPLGDRHCVIGPQQQYDMLTDTANTNLLLLKSNESQDGSALREGQIGRLFGFDVTMQQSVATVAATTVASGYPTAGDAQRALFFHRNSSAYVNRMMDSPGPGEGVNATVQSFMGQAIRIMIGYQLEAKRRVLSLDALWGWKIMRKEMGGSILSRATN